MARSDDVLVSFRAVDKSYDGEQYVVKDLDLDIRRGEFLTLLGPSGSGKTTCLMMLAGFEYPTHGEISLDGRVINRIPPHKREIGVVFQSYALFPHMTVWENVAYPLSIRRLDKAAIARRVDAALDMVRMNAYAQRRPAQLSGGQQQRIALARALIFDPPLVLMDEPLGALDKRLREHMQLEIKELHRRLNLTVVYVTHDQSEALTLSDRVAIFEGGRIQQIDEVRSLYETPSNRIVANFVGDSNQFCGVVTGGNGQVCEVALPDGTRIQGIADAPLPAGSPAYACIRPERIAVLDAAAPAANRIRARAMGLIYHGDHFRLQCTLGQEAGATCFIKVTLDDPCLRHFQPGQPVELGFDTPHVRIFP
ncbi:spermidine/putrescine ABC transporter ATPase [Bordetella sp. H567]|uniref:ABC transporter ATP-binding protein n=1 Tax=Bordetella sp. H567 TaxID=1697043 RepID=UPI00081C8713|nr:ABC transporter ATP-binding protein [Bordetella sp. H567]AOB29722.1 spermidine/putrescine ABC transporter ATPase [Bordetella sp. H567]